MAWSEICVSLEMGLIYGIIALGIYIAFRLIDFPDLTCDGSFVLGTAVCAATIQSGWNPWASLLAASVAGFAAGMVTGALNTYLRVSDLLSGILVGFMLYSVNLNVMGEIPNIALPDGNTVWDGPNYAMLLLACTALCTLLWCTLSTDWGLSIRSLGQNKQLARIMGVNVPLLTILALGLSNSLIALGGALGCQYQGFVDINGGVGTLIIALASIMMGEKIWPHHSLGIRIIACIIGSIVYRCIIGVALHSDILGIKTHNLNLITGILVLTIMYRRPKVQHHAQT